MEYILIPAKDKSEKDFLLHLLKRMRKETTTLSAEEAEDIAFLFAMKESEETRAKAKGVLKAVQFAMEGVL